MHSHVRCQARPGPARPPLAGSLVACEAFGLIHPGAAPAERSLHARRRTPLPSSRDPRSPPAAQAASVPRMRRRLRVFFCCPCPQCPFPPCPNGSEPSAYRLGPQRRVRDSPPGGRNPLSRAACGIASFRQAAWGYDRRRTRPCGGGAAQGARQRRTVSANRPTVAMHGGTPQSRTYARVVAIRCQPLSLPPVCNWRRARHRLGHTREGGPFLAGGLSTRMRSVPYPVPAPGAAHVRAAVLAQSRVALGEWLAPQAIAGAGRIRRVRPSVPP